MSDEKDPVREQIEKDAVNYTQHIPNDYDSCLCLEMYKTAAIYQDPIAWNRCLDEVIKEIDNESDYLMMSWKSKSAAALQAFKQKLEKLRR